MTDVFNAMKTHIDAITELLTANEIENKAQHDLEKARAWLVTCQKSSTVQRAKENESKILLTSAINTARKATRNTGVAVS